MNPYEERAMQAALLRSQGGATGLGTQMPGRSAATSPYSAAAGQQSNAGRTSSLNAGADFAKLLKNGGKEGGLFEKIGGWFGGGSGVPALGAEATGPGLQASGATTFAAGPETAIGAGGGQGGWMSSLFGGGGSGGGSALASAGPWAALAALIALNEDKAQGGKYNWTDDQGVEHKEPFRPDGWDDLWKGKSAYYDITRRFNPWMEDLTGGDSKRKKEGWWGKSGLGGDATLIAQTGNPSQWNNIGREELGNTTIGKLLKKIGDIF
jgi:hypothetical protein